MLNQHLLTTYFQAWLKYINRMDGKEFTSFGNSLYLESEEEYKQDIYHLGKKLLQVETWTADEIGTGKILTDVFTAIEFKASAEAKPVSNLKNNLVMTSVHSYTKASSPTKQFQDMLRDGDTLKAELILYSLYKNKESDQVCFEKLVDLLGKKYSLIAYLMFLKNDRKYLPLAPENFEKHLRLLGSSIQLSGQCSWENYMEFMSEMREVKNFLSQNLASEDVRLLDAHTFVWQLNLFSLEEEIIPPSVLQVIVDTDYVHSDFYESSKQHSISPEELEEVHRKNKDKGALVESIVLNYEKDALAKLGKVKEALLVRPVSTEDSALGYDILSVTDSGAPKYIEVKTVHKVGETLKFFVSLNEIRKSLHLENYYFYLVVPTKVPLIHILKSPFTSADYENIRQIELKSNIFVQAKNLYVSVPVKSVAAGY